MVQDNNKIVEVLKEFKEPIEVWQWDEDKAKAVCGDLIPPDSLTLYANISLTDPNKKKLIETQEEALAWKKQNLNCLVRCRNDYYQEARNLLFAENQIKDYFLLTGFGAHNTPIWTPLTEIEVV
jgi:hypothetical protein